MLFTEALTPSGEVQPINTIQAPVTINAIMAITLMMANQNSASPNIFTDSILNRHNSPKVSKAGSQGETSGYQYCM